MNPNTDSHAAAEKHLRALERERRALRKIQRDSPLIPLEQPYPRGWERWFEWLPEPLRRDDAARLPKLLEIIQKREVSRHLDFRCYDWRLRKEVAAPHELRRWSLWNFLNLRLPLEFWGYFETHVHEPLSQAYHLEHLRAIRWGGPISFRHPEWLVSRLGPHWITHSRVAMPEVDSRIQEIEAWMEQNRGWCKLGRLHGHRRWPAEGRRRRMLAALHRRETADEVQGWQEGADPSAPFPLRRITFLTTRSPPPRRRACRQLPISKRAGSSGLGWVSRTAACAPMDR